MLSAKRGVTHRDDLKQGNIPCGGEQSFPRVFVLVLEGGKDEKE